jgi:two-component system, NtrC family, sensor histidine kinase HydH
VSVVAEPLVVPVDKGKVKRIVENLLRNVARHTPTGTKVWLRAKREDGGVLVQVEDSGPGVPADVKDSIFEPFRQGPHGGMSGEGLGLGLSLVARFAELHGGRAWVDDRPDGGSIFNVFLPESSPKKTASSK